jgi:hypothetical protein
MLSFLFDELLIFITWKLFHAELEKYKLADKELGGVSFQVELLSHLVLRLNGVWLRRKMDHMWTATEAQMIQTVVGKSPERMVGVPPSHPHPSVSLSPRFPCCRLHLPTSCFCSWLCYVLFSKTFMFSGSSPCSQAW